MPEEAQVKLKHIIIGIILVDQEVISKCGADKYKVLVRVPLVLMTFTAGLLGGLQTSMMKGMTTSLSIDGLFALSTIGYGCLAVPLVAMQLKSLNVVMENYEQLNATPIYESSLIMMNITCGIIIMNDSQLYEWYELMLLVLYAMLIISGVFLIVNKPKQLLCFKFAEDPHFTPEIATTSDNADWPLTENEYYCSKRVSNCICSNHLSELLPRLNIKKLEKDQRTKVLQVIKVLGLVASLEQHSRLQDFEATSS